MLQDPGDIPRSPYTWLDVRRLCRTIALHAGLTVNGVLQTFLASWVAADGIFLLGEQTCKETRLNMRNVLFN